MNKISIRFYNKTLQKLQENAAKKEIPLAQYVRELVEVALRIEEISANINTKNETDAPTDSQTLWKNNLCWTLESLYLTRCLMNDLLPKVSEQYLTTAKQKAQSFVENLLDES